MVTHMTIELLESYEGLELPEYAHPGDSGFDLRCTEGFYLQPGEKQIIPCGLKFAVERGYEVQIRPRSGLAAKDGITVLNTPGTVDSGYRGEIKVILYNACGPRKHFKRGDRVAQVVVAPVEKVVMSFGPVDSSERGDAGFGSTGVS